ncbi:AP2 [Musa troglodytarum]|uniref:AP2 n=1 Tax=Musa troglodytarum TaxID=320322 RepID=A0A9E7L6L8_9LILI|nr:AP2 [Musa troglodytarum]
MGGGGEVPQQPGEAVARLVRDARDGGEGLRRCRVLPARPRGGAQLPGPAAEHTVGGDAEQVRDTGRGGATRARRREAAGGGRSSTGRW